MIKSSQRIVRLRPIRSSLPFFTPSMIRQPLRYFLSATAVKLRPGPDLTPSSNAPENISSVATSKVPGNFKDEKGVRPVIAVFSTRRYDLTRVAEYIQENRDPVEMRIGLQFPQHIMATPTQRRPRRPRPPELLMIELPHNNTIALLADGSVVGFGMSEQEINQFRQLKWLQQCETDEIVPSSSTPQPSSATATVSSGNVAASAGSSSSAAGVYMTVSIEDAFLRLRYTTSEDFESLGYVPPDGINPPFIEEGPLNAIVLQDSSVESKLPFVYCLSDMVKIDAYSAMLEKPALKVNKWRDGVRGTGKIPFTGKQARLQQSKLLSLTSRVAHLGDRPAIFTPAETDSKDIFQQQREVYYQACEYYEVFDRSDALAERVKSVNETLKYLTSESHAKVNHDLEVVICVLIGVEIVIHLFLADH